MNCSEVSSPVHFVLAEARALRPAAAATMRNSMPALLATVTELDPRRRTPTVICILDLVSSMGATRPQSDFVPYYEWCADGESGPLLNIKNQYSACMNFRISE